MALKLLEDTLRNAQQLAQSGEWTGALSVLNTVAPKETYKPEYKIFRARVLLGMGRDVDALSDLDDADSDVASPRLLAMRAEVEEKLGRVEAAIHTLGRALSVADDATLLARRAILLQGADDFAAAEIDILKAIKLRPSEGELYRILSTQHKFTADDPHLAQIRGQLGVQGAGTPNRMGFEFAYAKALDDCGNYEKAFEHYAAANKAMRKAFPYDISERLRTVETYQERFKDFVVQDYLAADPSCYAPIFITGMPRSGTTLVEQIISNHAHVQAGGETARFLPRMLETLGDPCDASLLMSPEKFGVLGQRYHADMLARLHIAKRHTDKSIQTILYAGPVMAALPKAKIIVVTRNPNAIALSLYKHVFRRGKQLYSYDLNDIRTYQKSFDDMVRFWQKRLPGAIMTVAYEDLVTKPKPTIRKMLKFVGLDWDEACLRPEDNTRAVQTLSAMAVRQAIGTHAKDHWRNYEQFLTQD